MLNFGLLSRLTYAERICAFAGNVVRVDDTNNIEAKIGGSAHNSARYMHTSACDFKPSIGRRRDGCAVLQHGGDRDRRHQSGVEVHQGDAWAEHQPAPLRARGAPRPRVN